MTKDNSKVNVPGLRAFYTSDPQAKVIFDHLAKFVKNMGSTKVDQLLWRLSSEDNPPNRWYVIRFFRKLEELGCGRLVVGRWNNKTRFEWSSGLVDVSHAAQGQDIKIGPAPQADAEVEVETAAGDAPTDDNVVEHPYLLRKGQYVRLQLPVDLTPAEAKRLADFIQTLPLPAESDGPTAA
ncbi:MAG TPA: hypothetical protein VEO19_14835 [Terriglobia bacterium]|nr:hypothetical protein [Terriglobia bacterium]